MMSSLSLQQRSPIIAEGVTPPRSHAVHVRSTSVASWGGLSLASVASTGQTKVAAAVVIQAGWRGMATRLVVREVEMLLLLHEAAEMQARAKRNAATESRV